MKYDYKENYLGNAKAQLTITVPAEEMKIEYDKQIAEIMKDAVIPGFRKGHVPASVIETKYRALIWADACSHKANDAFLEILTKLEHNMIGHDMPKPVETNDKPEYNKDYSITLEYDCVPDFKYKDLSSFEVVKDDVKIEKKDIDEQINKTLKEFATFEAKDGQIGKEDIAYINYSVKENGKEVYKNENEYINVKLNMDTYKIGEDIVGLKKGESKEYTKTFGDDAIDSLKGKKFDITLSVNEVKAEKIPAINDDILKEIDPELKSEDDLRKKFEADLQKYADNTVKQVVLARFTDDLIASYEGDVPECLIDDILDRELDEYKSRAKNAKKTLAEMLAAENLTEENFKTQKREEAIGGVKIGLIEQDLVKKNNLKASEEEIKDHIKEFSKYYKGIDPEMMYKFYAQQGQLEQIANQVETEKVHNYMTEQVKFKSGKTYKFSEMDKMFDDLNKELESKKK